MRHDGPPVWYLNAPSAIDWDHVHMLRSKGLATVPSASVPDSAVESFPRWPCLLCKVTFKSAKSVHDHVVVAHKKCHDFFVETPVFFTRCMVCS
jgi:hypothetical protein